MPFLNLRTVKGLLNDDQKKYLMEKFTELLIETEGGGKTRVQCGFRSRKKSLRIGKSESYAQHQKPLPGLFNNVKLSALNE